MAKIYASWRDFPLGDWRWSNFSPEEVASKGEGELLIDPDSMDKLQALRAALGKPLLITSAYRSAAHNARQGQRSQVTVRLSNRIDSDHGVE